MRILLHLGPLIPLIMEEGRRWIQPCKSATTCLVQEPGSFYRLSVLPLTLEEVVLVGKSLQGGKWTPIFYDLS